MQAVRQLHHSSLQHCQQHPSHSRRTAGATSRCSIATHSINKSRVSSMVLLQSVLQHHLAERPSKSATSCELTEQRLDDIYDSLDDIFYSKGGFIIPNREKTRIDATGGSSTYGEVQASGVDQIIRYLALDSSSVFMDLGCGRGRAVLQVAMHSPVAKAIGLELSDSRLEQAEMALEQLHQHGVHLQQVEFRQADLSSCSLEEGTHFYLCSTAFGTGICRSIAERLQTSPNFQALITSRQLPTQPYLYKLAEVPCEYSFNADGRAYIYVKSPAAAPAAVLAKLWCRDGVCWLPSVYNMQLGMSVDEPLVGASRQYVQVGVQHEPQETVLVPALQEQALPELQRNFTMNEGS